MQTRTLRSSGTLAGAEWVSNTWRSLDWDCQTARLIDADTPAPPRSLFQKPRSPAENALFYKGLSQLHVWYGHAQTVCWMQSELPPGFAEEMEKLKLARSYEESGWCARRVWQKPPPPVLL